MRTENPSIEQESDWLGSEKVTAIRTLVPMDIVGTQSLIMSPISEPGVR